MYLIKYSDFGKYIDIWRAVCYTERVGGMAMIERKNYLEKLIAWKDEQVIKVVTGIRRCGKSTLLDLFKEYLKKSGVGDEQIVAVNFEDLENEAMRICRTDCATVK